MQQTYTCTVFLCLQHALPEGKLHSFHVYVSLNDSDPDDHCFWIQMFRCLNPPFNTYFMNTWGQRHCIGPTQNDSLVTYMVTDDVDVQPDDFFGWTCEAGHKCPLYLDKFVTGHYIKLGEHGTVMNPGETAAIGQILEEEWSIGVDIMVQVPSTVAPTTEAITTVVTTESLTTVQDTTIRDTTVPDTTVPDTTIRDTTMRDTTVQGTTLGDTTLKDTTAQTTEEVTTVAVTSEQDTQSSLTSSSPSSSTSTSTALPTVQPTAPQTGLPTASPSPIWPWILCALLMLLIITIILLTVCVIRRMCCWDRRSVTPLHEPLKDNSSTTSSDISLPPTPRKMFHTAVVPVTAKSLPTVQATITNHDVPVHRLMFSRQHTLHYVWLFITPAEQLLACIHVVFCYDFMWSIIMWVVHFMCKEWKLWVGSKVRDNVISTWKFVFTLKYWQ